MCTFCKTSDLSTQKKDNHKSGNKFISLFLKPNKDNENYRFRLLFYRQEKKNDRTKPYIVQKVHDHWGVSPKGINIVDDLVVCPGTDYVHYDEDKFVLNPKTGKNEVNCPICAKSRENFAIYANSGRSDKISSSKGYQLKSHERLCAPVYVVSDPNNEKNNGKLKVLILTESKDIKAFQDAVDTEKTKSYLLSKQGTPYEVFNGQNAVNINIHVETVPEIRNQGKPNESIANKRKITQIFFDREPSTISAITKEAIDNFEFDDQFYFSNTKAELEAFYNKYYGQNNITPDEDKDVFISQNNQSIPTTPQKVAPVVENTTQQEIDDDLDQLDSLVTESEDENNIPSQMNTSNDDSPNDDLEISPEMSKMFEDLGI